ncbi:hypothetical protein Tco_0140990 [Tanacetum coccineum]
MAAPTIPVSAKENLGDPIDIKVDIIHPEPVAIVAFLVAVIVRTQVQHREAIRGIHEYFQWVPIEAENASLRGNIKSMEAIETITRSQEKRACMEMERQLASVQESQRQDQESFRKLQEKERIKPLRVLALVMTIGLDLPKQILNAQTGAQKPENLKHEDIGGMIKKDIPKEKLEIE